MSWDIIMHVNYCEQGQTIDEICQKAVKWGFDGVEFRRKRVHVNESVEEYLDAIEKGVKKYGLKTVIFGGPGASFTNPDPEKREADLNEMINFYKLASKRFNLTVCNTMAGSVVNPDKSIPPYEYDKHGSFAATEEQWKWAAEGFKVLGELAEELNFKFAFEVHMNYIHDLPQTTKKLVDMINVPSVGINLDYGNVVYFKNKPTLKEAIEVVKDKLYYVHLKNSVGLRDGSRFPTGLCEGEINHREYLKLLKENNYTGPICIEAPRSGDREWYAKQDIAYIKSVIEDIL
ncbi:MAG TPA: sugar phosphate isomerase/epimerase [Clostridiaceae bacterium]|nr:sugar phosphate isomerase/epimerase [Clostridiaceae bacterium]